MRLHPINSFNEQLFQFKVLRLLQILLSCELYELDEELEKLIAIFGLSTFDFVSSLFWIVLE